MARRQTTHEGSGNADARKEPSSKIVTFPTALTAARVGLGYAAARKLHRGERGALPYLAAAAASDAEGFVARWIDKRWPESGRGSTRFGAMADKYADTAAALMVGAGAVTSPRVGLRAKAGMAAVLIQEADKTAWALREGTAHRKQTGENLDLPPSKMGKAATVAKFVAGIATAASAELGPDSQFRGIAETTALVAGAAGAFMGNLAIGQYENDLHPPIETVHLLPPEPIPA